MPTACCWLLSCPVVAIGVGEGHLSCPQDPNMCCVACLFPTAPPAPRLGCPHGGAQGDGASQCCSETSGPPQGVPIFWSTCPDVSLNNMKTKCWRRFSCHRSYGLLSCTFLTSILLTAPHPGLRPHDVLGPLLAHKCLSAMLSDSVVSDLWARAE